jgi:hypothetical protein
MVIIAEMLLRVCGKWPFPTDDDTTEAVDKAGDVIQDMTGFAVKGMERMIAIGILFEQRAQAETDVLATTSCQ